MGLRPASGCAVASSSSAPASLSRKNIIHGSEQQQCKIPSAPPSVASSVQNEPSVAGESGRREAPDEKNAAVVDASADKRQEQAADGEVQQHKIYVGFGQPESSDLTVMLYGKEGIAVRMSVHNRNVLRGSNNFFAENLSDDGHGGGSPVACVEIHDCDDAEIYVVTVGMMYCDEAKHKLLKQYVSRVLRIMKVVESLGFHACVKSYLDYLETVPWVGDEEHSVLSSIQHFQSKAYGVIPLLKSYV